MSCEFIKVKNEGGIINITLDKPPLNVLTIKMIKELTHAFEWAQQEPGHLILLDAAGKSFSAGVDIGEHRPDKVTEMNESFSQLIYTMCDAEKPIICAVDGLALGGGCELALCADVIVASERAAFGQPEVKVGSLAYVACYILPRILSWSKALELLLSGEKIGAARAEQIGLVNAVLPADNFADGVQDYLKKFLDQSSFILKMIKKAAVTGRNKELVEALKDIELINTEEIMTSHDGIEGLSAFLEKRKPIWLGK
ncbi:MAG: enoyl-CoA hydratase/carnithine racemase [Firmicutes bacterium]|nr:enoyl-CoA hydratase/carnithine racemase [Bacillota bacterium]